METKEQLVTNVKEWIKVDTEINEMKASIKDKIAKKKALSDQLMTTMKQHEIDCFDINGGSLVYKKSRVKKPINCKSLVKGLQVYFREDVKMAEELAKHLLEGREEQVKETLKRKIDK